MAGGGSRTQIPLNPPFSKGEFSRGGFNPSLEKREGEIFGGELCGQLQLHDTSVFFGKTLLVHPQGERRRVLFVLEQTLAPSKMGRRRGVF